jgi:thioredoxin reductase
VVLCADGPAEFTDEHREELLAHGIPVVERRLLRMEGEGGRLERLVFDGGEALERRALFFVTSQRMHSDLAARLGCRFTEAGVVDTGDCEATNVRGLYVAGDASKETQLVSVAIAEGTQAGFAINRDLVKEDLARGR